MTVMETQFNGRVIAGRYQLGSRRGSGLDAAVFDAFDLVEHRVVAMKVVHPDLSAMPGFERDFRFAAEQAAGIKHPNIAQTLDWGADTWNDRRAMYVIVEHLAGGSLRDYLDRGRTLSSSQALMVGLDTCRALDVLHRRGIFHGDIRPSTLMFGDDSRLRVTDVGLAAVVGNVVWADPMHVSNILATYASPELAESGQRGAKGDVYSLCLTLLESVTGTVPFVGDSPVATLANRIGRLMPVSADLGPLAAVFEHAGRPDPDDRLSAAALGRALMQAAEKLPRPAPINLPNGGLFGDPSAALERPGFAPAAAARRPAPSAAPPPAAPPPQPEAEVAARRGPWRWLLPLIAVLGLAAGAIGYEVTRDRTHTYVVPHLVGLTEAEALNQISEFNWDESVVREASDDVASGVVIRTEPQESTSVQEHKPFQLVVSSGPAPRPLPDLVGLTVDQATSQLTRLGLTLHQGDPAYDESVPSGVVISWMVPEQPGLKAGDTVTRGTTIDVVVSAGPQPRVVPDLTGMTVDDATATLAGQGLLLTQSEPQFSDAVAPGLIMAQDLVAGTDVARGSTITVATSKGPDVVPVPPLANLTLQQVTDTLGAAGLSVGTVSGNPDGVLVAAQYKGVDLLPGQLLPRGAGIDITLA